MQRLALHERHAAGGAVFEEALGWSMPASYGPGPEAGAVAREYVAAREAAGIVDLSERALLAVTGPQRQKFLHGILSSDILDREPGKGCLASLMTVKGHLLAFMRALVTKDAVLLETSADCMKLVEDTLVHYKVGAPVRFQPRPATILGLLGPRARPALAKAGLEIPDLPSESHVTGALAGHDVLVARAGDLPCAGLVLHATPEVAPAVWDALVAAGARPLGRRALDALRVEAGRAWYGPDVTEENLLHETGLVGEYHSPTKGCYVGQEVIARLEARGGHVNRMIRGLRLSAPAARGTSVAIEGKEVGRVTTAAVSPRLGPIALGYVHRSHFAPGTAVEVGGAPATVVALPFEGAAG